MEKVVNLIDKKISDLKQIDFDNDTIEFLSMFNCNITSLCKQNFVDLVMLFYMVKLNLNVESALDATGKIYPFLEDMEELSYEDVLALSDNFYEIKEKFDDELGNWTYADFMKLKKFDRTLSDTKKLLKEYSSPNDIKNIHLTKLTNILHDNSHGRYNRDDAIRLRELAKSSVGIDNPSLSLQVKHAILQIELYDEQIAEIEALYKQILDEMNTPILSIPGMSYNQAAVIIGCIGDIHRFEHSCQLLAYAGLDPSVIQSGNFQARSTKMSKRGSGMLRYSLVYSAHNVVKNNKTFRDYYEIKRSQGKSHYCALGHVAHKLVRIIFKMLKDNVVFNLD